MKCPIRHFGPRKASAKERFGIVGSALVCGWNVLTASEPSPTRYFEACTALIEDRSLAEVRTREDWEAQRQTRREQLREMLGLMPWPERADLRPAVTAVTEEDVFRVERIHFQSMPGLYVTANLYVPKQVPKPLPAILYVCGHGRVAKDDVSFGNKVHYQHHGAWFARHGYLCFILDTIQLGEIEGIHHGTYREGMWWWNARGYTPAGVEAWNGIRALDYLETRPEVDATRFGVTGRSGGGAYSWWVAALDDRIQVAAPVAGITDLRNHVVDGVVEGHCDCMYMVNTYGWDYAEVAALLCPRPLLIVNTDSDRIFPLDGVSRIFGQVRRLYGLHGAADKVGLLIGPGPHKDTQDLQVPVFRWFNQYLKGEDPMIEAPAQRYFEPESLKVFASLPAEECITSIHESFVPRAARPSPPNSAGEWSQRRAAWRSAIEEKCFRAWPRGIAPPRLRPVVQGNAGGVEIGVYEFESEPWVPLRLYVLRRAGQSQPEGIRLTVLHDERYEDAPTPEERRSEPSTEAVASVEIGFWESPSYEYWLAVVGAGYPDVLTEELAGAGSRLETKPELWRLVAGQMVDRNEAWAFLAPRGLGADGWSRDRKDQVQTRRRFMLLGRTLDGMRVWDVCRAVEAARTLPGWRSVPMRLQGRGIMAVNVLYASLFAPDLAGVELWNPSDSHARGPDYLNVLRYLDVPQAAAMAAEIHPLRLHQVAPEPWQFAVETARYLGWGEARVRWMD